LTVGLGLGICVAPLLLWGQALRSYFLKLDDFYYLAESRSGSALLLNLFKPHNAHVVPLFRLETYLLTRLAGTLERTPEVFGLACYLNLLLAMLLAGHLVARETCRVFLGLAAMAGVGLSTVLGPAVLWYAAGQALASGTVILAMLIALCVWRKLRSTRFLLLACLAAMAAPMFWSAGYTAGPVAVAYLAPHGRSADRIAACLVLAVSLAIGGFIWLLFRPAVLSGGTEHGDASQLIRQIPTGLAHTAQAIPEILILNNVGLDASTTRPQGLALCAMLALAWFASSGKRRVNSHGREWGWSTLSPRIGRLLSSLHRLEAAGAVLIVASFWLIYTGRGDYSFDNLRALGWYHALPQLGVVLFAVGWWWQHPEPSSVARFSPPTFAELLCVAGLTTILLLLQMPRASRVIFDFDGAAAAVPVGGSQSPARPASRANLAARALSQRRALSRLDRAEKIAREDGISRSEIREIVGRFNLPGLPAGLTGLDAIDLMSLPESGSLANPEAIRGAVRAALSDESP
jgi:hypothetical protein